MRRARFIVGHLDAARRVIAETSREIGEELSDDAVEWSPADRRASVLAGALGPPLGVAS